MPDVNVDSANNTVSMEPVAKSYEESPEDIVKSESEQLLSRNNKYRLVTLPMAIFSKLRPNRGPYLESAYYFARHIDDVLDGDRSLGNGWASPNEYIESVVYAMENGFEDGLPSITRLYEHAMSFTREGSEEKDRMKRNFLRLVDVMRFDYERQEAYGREDPIILSQRELHRYYRETFEPALEITSQIIDSHFISEHTERFSVALGRMYSISDLRQDLSRGIINIPREVLNGLEIIPAVWLWEDVNIQGWAMSELEQGEKDFKSLKAEVAMVSGAKARTLLGLLSAGPMRYKKQMSQLWQI